MRQIISRPTARVRIHTTRTRYSHCHHVHEHKRRDFLLVLYMQTLQLIVGRVTVVPASAVGAYTASHT